MYSCFKLMLSWVVVRNCVTGTSQEQTLASRVHEDSDEHEGQHVDHRMGHYVPNEEEADVELHILEQSTQSPDPVYR